MWVYLYDICLQNVTHTHRDITYTEFTVILEFELSKPLHSTFLPLHFVIVTICVDQLIVSHTQKSTLTFSIVFLFVRSVL